MKSNRIALSVLAGLMVVTSLPVRADDKPVTLARTYKKGDVVRRKAEAAIVAGGMDVSATTLAKTTVKEIKDNGQVVLEEAGEGGKVSVGGQEMDIPPTPPMTVTREKSGKLVDFKMDASAQGLSAPEIARLVASIETPIFQDKAVKPGDSWETEVENPAAKGKKVKVKTTFIGLDKVDGVDHWKVKQSAEAATGDGDAKMGYEATYWLDPATGQEVKSESEFKALPTQFGPLDMKVKSAKMKEGAK